MADNSIKINILVGQEGQKLTKFIVKEFTPLEKVFETYAQRQQLPLERFVFRFNGQLLNALDTPQQHGMQDDDRITVELAKSNTIELKLETTNGDPVKFRVNRNMPFKGLFENYRERLGLRQVEIRFCYGDGLRLKDHETPEEHNMQNGDLIEVHVHTDGGGYF